MTLKILVLGATGMLGHKLIQGLSKDYEVTGTIRRDSSVFKKIPIFSETNLIGNIDGYKISTIDDAIKELDPDVVINCIGIVKQLKEAQDPVKSIIINSLFPNQLADICVSKNIRLIHYSTDCVFSGRKGKYVETDFPDADDLYGRTKFLGELNQSGCLTLRTSIIGRELVTAHSLIEWFLSQEGKSVNGFTKAIFSGLTTNSHANIVKKIIGGYPDLEGLYHLAGDPISKYELLTIVKKQYGLSIRINPDEHEVSDRSLSVAKFKSDTEIVIPSWLEMIKEMYEDTTPYDQMRMNNANK
jgi:dTDP-4-dehydrorhamnose reductase